VTARSTPSVSASGAAPLDSGVHRANRVRDGSEFERLASYSRGARAGAIVAVSGTAALGPDGTALYPDDAYLQTRTAFERALEAAQRLGVERDHVIRTRIFLAPGSDWRAAARAHGELFSGVDPANTTLFVAGFIPAGCLVEVEVDGVADTTA
jgi:enamine deaminase RidA (YjgF/YER057c/UK114 family)